MPQEQPAVSQVQLWREMTLLSQPRHRPCHVDEKDIFAASSWTKKLWGSGAVHRVGSPQIDSDSSVDVTWVGGVGRREKDMELRDMEPGPSAGQRRGECSVDVPCGYPGRPCRTRER